EWEYQKKAAKNSIENLTGVRFVKNLISVKPKISAIDVQRKINTAFHRSATINSGKVKAEVDGSKVILRGTVRSFAEKENAENAAWSAPGVTSVINKIEIDVPEYEYE